GPIVVDKHMADTPYLAIKIMLYQNAAVVRHIITVSAHGSWSTLGRIHRALFGVGVSVIEHVLLGRAIMTDRISRMRVEIETSIGKDQEFNASLHEHDGFSVTITCGIEKIFTLRCNVGWCCVGRC